VTRLDRDRKAEALGLLNEPEWLAGQREAYAKAAIVGPAEIDGMFEEVNVRLAAIVDAASRGDEQRETQRKALDDTIRRLEAAMRAEVRK
jgi:hypothetical protein